MPPPAVGDKTRQEVHHVISGRGKSAAIPHEQADNEEIGTIEKPS